MNGQPMIQITKTTRINKMITLSTDQQNAADKFIEFILDDDLHEMALQGHAGTGKTFMTKYMVDLVSSANELSDLLHTPPFKEIYLTATTNKAVEVLGRLAKSSEVSTIHSLLKLKVKNNYKTGGQTLVQHKSFRPLQNCLVVVDEASMVDKQLRKMIQQSCANCKVLYILDPYQLAPVGMHTCPVADQVKNKAVLKHIFRQKGGNTSPIAEFAEKYRKVQDGAPFPKIEEAGNEIIRVDGPAFQAMVEKEFDSIDHDTDKAKILTWTNASVKQYNDFIRSLHTDSDKPEIGEYMITNKPIISPKRIHDVKTDGKVQIKDISANIIPVKGIDCWIVDIGLGYEVPLPTDQNKLSAALKKLAARSRKSGNWMEYFELQETFVDLRPAYASTVHKSQGSTHDIVFINLNDIGNNPTGTEVARLMYVAITRAVNQVILYGRLGTRYGD